MQCSHSDLQPLELKTVTAFPPALKTIHSYFAFYVRKQLLLSAHLNHGKSVCPSVRPSVTLVDQSKTVQARITKSSPTAPWKTLVSGNVKLFHKLKGGHPKQGR